MDILVGLAFGAFGGAMLGLKGYLEARKDDGSPFDSVKFGSSLVLAAIAGAAMGVFADTPEIAFIAGFVGKSVQELGSSYLKK
jgi:hypothetical protein